MRFFRSPRSLPAVAISVAASLVTVGLAAPVSVAGASTPTALTLSTAEADGALGGNCAGFHMDAIPTGFDPATQFPQADVYLSAGCGGGSGRGGGGGHERTGWFAVEWDDTGALVSLVTLTTPAPTTLPTAPFSDTYGNTLSGSASYLGGGACPEPTAITPSLCSYTATLTLAPGFVPVPRLLGSSASLVPANGGTTVTLVGTGFTGATAVEFGSTPAASFTVNSDTSITAVTPVLPAGDASASVTTPGGVSGTVEMTSVPTPVISSVSPSFGPPAGGTLIQLTGTGFTYVTSVTFGGVAASFTVNSDTSITAWAPANDEGGSVPIVATTINGASATSSATSYDYLPVLTCTKLSGNINSTVTLSKCDADITSEKKATSTSLTGTWTWSPNGQTTITSVDAPYSPGQGACKKGSTEEDLSGTVAGGTSSFTYLGFPISAQVCITASGAASLVKGTIFTL